MTPAHVATLAALSSVVAALKKSKTAACKAILEDLKENHAHAFVETVDIDFGAAADSDLSGADYVSCCLEMNISRKDIDAGAVPCIVDGRYAVRTEGGLKLGPKVS